MPARFQSRYQYIALAATGKATAHSHHSNIVQAEEAKSGSSKQGEEEQSNSLRAEAQCVSEPAGDNSAAPWSGSESSECRFDQFVLSVVTENSISTLGSPTPRLL